MDIKPPLETISATSGQSASHYWPPVPLLIPAWSASHKPSFEANGQGDGGPRQIGIPWRPQREPLEEATVRYFRTSAGSTKKDSIQPRWHPSSGIVSRG